MGAEMLMTVMKNSLIITICYVDFETGAPLTK